MNYNGIDRRSKAKVFGCLEIHQRDIGEFFGTLFKSMEKEKIKMKAYLVTGVDKNGKPVEKEIEFDEQQARVEYDDIFDPMQYQHEKKEREHLEGY